MTDELVKLIKKGMLNECMYGGLDSASIRLNEEIIHGYILKFNKGDMYLFISNRKNGRYFHSGYSVFGSYAFRDRCLWIDDSDLATVCRGMLI